MFNTYIYQPILSVLVFIYEHVALHDVGFAIILLTIFIRIVLFPLFYKGAKDQTIAQKIQPKIKEIQEKHKDDKEQQARAFMELYKEHKFNPFSGIFTLILQIPIFIALFRMFNKELSNPIFSEGVVFLGILNLGEKSIALALVAAGLQFLQAKLAMPKQTKTSSSDQEKQMLMMQKMMLWMGPLFSLFILSSLPSALGLYWIASTLFGIGQQLYINKKISTQ